MKAEYGISDALSSALLAVFLWARVPPDNQPGATGSTGRRQAVPVRRCDQARDRSIRCTIAEVLFHDGVTMAKTVFAPVEGRLKYRTRFGIMNYR